MDPAMIQTIAIAALPIFVILVNVKIFLIRHFGLLSLNEWQNPVNHSKLYPVKPLRFDCFHSRNRTAGKRHFSRYVYI